MTDVSRDVNINAMEQIMKEALIKEVEVHLHSMIDSHIKDVAKDAVVRFLSIDIMKQHNKLSMSDEYYFKFVQNITKTIVKTKIVKEVE